MVIIMMVIMIMIIIMMMMMLTMMIVIMNEGRKCLFNDALDTYDVEHMVTDHSYNEKPAAATTWATLLYDPFHIQDSTYHGLCYTSRGALAGVTISSVSPP